MPSITKYIESPEGEKFIRKILRRKMKFVGEFVRTAAFLNCPFISGNLRDSITPDVDENERFVFVNIGTNVVYAAPVEARKPYLMPALTDNQQAIKYIFNKG